jgi:hypothetical protein
MWSIYNSKQYSSIVSSKLQIILKLLSTFTINCDLQNLCVPLLTLRNHDQRGSYLLKEHSGWGENRPSARRRPFTTCCVHKVLQYLKDLVGEGSSIDELAVVL